MTKGEIKIIEEFIYEQEMSGGSKEGRATRTLLDSFTHLELGVYNILNIISEDLDSVVILGNGQIPNKVQKEALHIINLVK